MDCAQLLVELTAAAGVSGTESAAARAALPYLEPLGPCEATPLGSLLCRVKTAPPQKPHLLLTAHMDEIGLAVTYIDEKGFLHVANVGGVDRAALPGGEVTVHTDAGPLPGIVCTVPGHLGVDEGKLPKMEDIRIDVGMGEAAVKSRVALGDRVTPCFQAMPLLGDRFCARALDDRAGCAAVLLAATELAGRKLDGSLSVLLASMEEVGGEGALTGARQVMPTHAIAVDVSFAHTPDARRSECGEMGGGAMIGVAPILDNGMFSRLKQIALQEKIPFQVEVMGRATGTDADAVAVAGSGVRTALLSVPLKYMHMPVEVVSLGDIKAVADLIAAYAKDAFGGAD